MTLRHIAIIGAGPAGLTAAETLRRHGYAGRMTIVGDETHQPYDRPPLSKQILAGTWQPDRLALRSGADIEALDVDLQLGVQAIGLDPGEQRVELSDGRPLAYDGLVIATGVHPRPWSLGDLNGIHTLRTIDDALELRTALLRRPTVVVIGAGFLGAEAASVCRGMGLHVTLVDPLPTPMFRQVGPIVGALVARLHADHGTVVRTETGVAELVGAGGHVAGVRLTDGTLLPADVVIVAIGSTPNTRWLASSGLAISDGLDCDERCSAAPGTVGAGDVANWLHPTLRRRIRVEHRMNATEHAIRAAETLLGMPGEYAPIPYFWSDQYDVKIQAYGQWPVSADVHVRADGDRFVALYGWQGRVVGALAWNAGRRLLALRRHIVEQRSWADVEHLTV